MIIYSRPVGTLWEDKIPIVTSKRVSQANGFVIKHSVAVMYAEYER